MEAENEDTKQMGEYFEQHKNQLQVVWFLIFGLMALIVLLGGNFAEATWATAFALSPVLYQACGVASQLIYGIGDAVIVFFMDKYLIMKRSA